MRPIIFFSESSICVVLILNGQQSLLRDTPPAAMDYHYYKVENHVDMLGNNGMLMRGNLALLVKSVPRCV